MLSVNKDRMDAIHADYQKRYHAVDRDALRDLLLSPWNEPHQRALIDRAPIEDVSDRLAIHLGQGSPPSIDPAALPPAPPMPPSTYGGEKAPKTIAATLKPIEGTEPSLAETMGVDARRDGIPAPPRKKATARRKKATDAR